MPITRHHRLPLALAQQAEALEVRATAWRVDVTARLENGKLTGEEDVTAERRTARKDQRLVARGSSTRRRRR